MSIDANLVKENVDSNEKKLKIVENESFLFKVAKFIDNLLQDEENKESENKFVEGAQIKQDTNWFNFVTFKKPEVGLKKVVTDVVEDSTNKSNQKSFYELLFLEACNYTDYSESISTGVFYGTVATIIVSHRVIGEGKNEIDPTSFYARKIPNATIRSVVTCTLCLLIGGGIGFYKYWSSNKCNELLFEKYKITDLPENQ